MGNHSGYQPTNQPTSCPSSSIPAMFLLSTISEKCLIAFLNHAIHVLYHALYGVLGVSDASPPSIMNSSEKVSQPQADESREMSNTDPNKQNLQVRTASAIHYHRST